jgi:hypothetical protein
VEIAEIQAGENYPQKSARQYDWPSVGKEFE